MGTAQDVDKLRTAIDQVGGLVLAADLHRLLGVSKQRAHKLREREDFPPPMATTLEGRPVWTGDEIAAWDAGRTRVQGR